MYGLHITFDDGSEPFSKFKLSRRQYGDEMLKRQIDYDLEIERVDDFKSGDRMIFVNAHKRTTEWILKNIERRKSRARYYTRRAGIDGKEGRT